MRMNEDNVQPEDPRLNALVRSSRPSRLKVALLAILAPIFMLSGVLGGAATPATAATIPPYGIIRECFTFFWGGGTGAWQKPVNLDAYLAGNWVAMTTYTPTASDGCIGVAVPAGYTYRFRVSLKPYSNMSTYCSGTSNAVTVRQGYTYNMGRLYVTCR